jgi:hypothetical protein
LLKGAHIPDVTWKAVLESSITSRGMVGRVIAPVLLDTHEVTK